MSWQPATVYETVRESTQETTIGDVLLGAAAVILGLAVLALVLGVVLAGVLITVRRLRGRDGAHGGNGSPTRLGLDVPSSSPASPKT